MVASCIIAVFNLGLITFFVVAIATEYIWGLRR